MELEPVEQPLIGVSPALVSACEQALQKEERLDGILQLTKRINLEAWDMQYTTRQHVDILKDVQQFLKQCEHDLKYAIRTALKAKKAKRATLRATADYIEAAKKAEKAAAAFAGATDDELAQRARAADAAAKEEADAYSDAAKAVKTAMCKSNLLRSVLRGIARRSAGLEREFEKVEKTAGKLAAAAGRLEKAIQEADKKITLSAGLQRSAAQGLLAVREVEEEVKTMPDRLQMLRDLTPEMEIARDQEPADAGPIKAYFHAAVNAVIEVNAYAYISAVRKASLTTCTPGMSCRADLDAELATAEDLMVLAEREAHALAKPARAAIDVTDAAIRLVNSLLGPAAADHRMAKSFVSKATAAEGTIKDMYEAAKSDQDAANKNYLQAKKASEAAYLAAYGKPRPAPELPIIAEFHSGEKFAESHASFVWEVETHAWEFFTAIEGESSGYGAYTYVLFGRRMSNRLSSQVKQRYEALLDAIISTTAHRIEIDEDIPSKKVNLFCIPGKKALEGGIDLSGFNEYMEEFSALDNYASSLAYKYLSKAGNGAFLREEILNQIKYSPGPFLLTTVKPLLELRTYSPMLFVDLSRFHPDTFVEIVTNYKHSMVENPPDEQKYWTPSTLKWVVITAYDFSIHLAKVKSTVTAWLSKDEKMPVKIALR